MIGGEDEDLAELVEQCNRQVNSCRASTGQEQPQAGPSRSGVGRAGPTLGDRMGPQVDCMEGAVGGAGITGNQMKTFLEQNQKLMEMMARQNQRSDDDGGKRKRDEVSYIPQEPVLLVENSYKLEDDAHENIDFSLRQKLRPINRDPTEYWKKGSFERVDRPILGSTLYLDHLMPGSVNEHTICKNHDRWAIVEIKNFLTKNSGVARERQKHLKVREVANEELSMGIQTVWEQASSVWEVMDAGFNYVAVEFMTRNYNYTGLAMLRVLHECRYFCGVASNPKQQRTLIECFFNECFKVINCVKQEILTYMGF